MAGSSKGRQKKAPQNTFSDNLGRLIDEYQVSLRTITKATGIPASTLLSWRRGGTPSDFASVARLAKFFNTSLSSLLLGVQESKPDVSVAQALATLFKEGQKVSGYLKYDLTLLTPRKDDGGDHE